VGGLDEPIFQGFRDRFRLRVDLQLLVRAVVDYSAIYREPEFCRVELAFTLASWVADATDVGRGPRVDASTEPRASLIIENNHDALSCWAPVWSTSGTTCSSRATVIPGSKRPTAIDRLR
jgi:hypothetical protein